MLQLMLQEDDINQQDKLTEILAEISADEQNKKIFNTLADAWQRKQRKGNLHYLQIRKQDKIERIFLHHVRYFVSDRRKIKAVFDSPNDSLEFYMKMQDMEDQLQNCNFLRCHQSYLVNIQQILYWDNTTIVLTGNEKIPVSRKYKEEVTKKLENMA